MRRAFAISVVSALLLWLSPPQAKTAENLSAHDLGSCRRLSGAQARLQCYEALTPSDRSTEASPKDFPRQWHIVRSPGPDGPSISMIHTADTTRSDPDFAGFSIHCGKDGPEFLLAVIKPMGPRARPRVTIKGGGREIVFVARPLPSGGALLLPPEAKVLEQNPWRALEELAFTVSDGDYSLHGVVQSRGFAEALDQVSAVCPDH